MEKSYSTRPACSSLIMLSVHSRSRVTYNSSNTAVAAGRMGGVSDENKQAPEYIRHDVNAHEYVPPPPPRTSGGKH